MNCAPWLVSTRDMSGNADSKQTSTPTSSGLAFPVGLATVSVCAPSPAIMFDCAALLIFVRRRGVADLGEPADCLLDRDVLAERYEPRLYVAALNALRADQDRDLLLAAVRPRDNGVLADQDLRPFLSGQLLDAAEQGVVGRQVVGDARLTPDDEVGMLLRERGSRAELPGQGLRGVDPLHGVVDAGYARLHEC